MANRYLYQFKGSFEPGVVQIFAKISFGAAGAPTLVQASSNPANINRGIQSIVRNSTGNYTITLMDSYVRLLEMSKTSVVASGVSTAPTLVVEQDNTPTLAAPTLVIQLSSSGTPADPASGEVILLNILLKNSAA